MQLIKTVGIKILKNNLSSYLKDVRGGVLLLVTDRDQVIAEIRRPSADIGSGKAIVLKSEWIEKGILIPGNANKKPYPPSPLHLPDGTSRRLLDDDRGE